MQLILTKSTRIALILFLILALTTTSVLAASYLWQNVGPAGFSAGSVFFTSLALDGSTPYVAYSDDANSFKATVMRFNGTSWETVGTAGFSAGAAEYSSLALEGSTPYVAYKDGDKSGKSTVMNFNGTSWENVGLAGFSAGPANNTSLALDGSTPYVAYVDGGNSYKATVMKFNGTSWEAVGTAGFSAASVDGISLALDGSAPYVAYTDFHNSYKATVMRFNGTSWETVGPAGFSAGRATRASLALDGSTPYVAYSDYTNSYKATVMRFNGTSWETVGTAGFSAGTASSISLALDGSTPYVAYQDGGNSNKATVMRFSGTSWETVGTAGFSARTVSHTSLALDGSTPYVAYQDNSKSSKATMMAFTAPPSVSTISPANGATIQSTSTLTVDFSTDMLHDGTAHAADTASNYLLVEANGDGFQTTTCLAGVSGNDSNFPIINAAYSNNGGGGPYRATLEIAPLGSGSYQLLVCGSASIYDLAGNVLNGGADTAINFSVAAAVAVQPSVLPQTGFRSGVDTQLPEQKLSEIYQQYNTVSLEIPSLDVEAPIVGVPVSEGGWNLTWLGDQAGWLHGTTFPSWAGNSAITAHVVDSNGKPGLFENLGELKWGDEVIVHAYGQAYVYTVRSVEKYVQPDDTSSAFEHEEFPWLTLITCKGYDEDSDSYDWRVVVRAVQTRIY
jgi:LPXTG-site transpeptidase (sortase) family protein